MLIGADVPETDSSVPPTATESAKGEMSQGIAGVELIVGEPMTFSVRVTRQPNRKRLPTKEIQEVC